MLHRIKGLFQKTSCQKTGKSGDNILNSRGNFALENPTQERIQQNQHGRSMTEMLGVLAIMGVLSIGALAGYRYAMDKQRANATMNDINLRGVDLVIQASRNIPLNLDEWSNTSTAGYTFGTPEHVADGFVKLPVSGLPKRVCEMVVDGLSGQYDMDINGAQIDTRATCGDDNIITVYFDATGPIGDDECGGCPGAQTCVNGVCTCTNGGTGENCERDLCEGVSCGECQECQAGACVNLPDTSSCFGGSCEAGYCVNADQPVTFGRVCSSDAECGECYYCRNSYCDEAKPEGSPCSIGTCERVSGSSELRCVADTCQTNDDCKANEICADTNESSCSPNPYKCVKINGVTKTVTLADGTKDTWYFILNNLTWWDAKQACAKIGRSLPSENQVRRGTNAGEGLFKLLSESDNTYAHLWLSDESGCQAKDVAVWYDDTPWWYVDKNESMRSSSRYTICH